ncbi:MAG: hypothetical protein HY648_13045, partial [Acidobacteria bacterium]|nr:hypothetical protein [Acidobacteriota bacterium]
MKHKWIRALIIGAAVISLPFLGGVSVLAQGGPPAEPAPSASATTQAAPPQAQPGGETAPIPSPAPAAQAPQPQPSPTTSQPAAAAGQQPGEEVPIALHLENADLLQVVGILAAELKINYVVDPDVKGTVII